MPLFPFLYLILWISQRIGGKLCRIIVKVSGAFSLVHPEMGFYPNPEAIAAEIKKAARESYRIREDLSSSVTFILASIHRSITALSKALKELNKAIEGQSRGLVNPLVSVKGIGPVYATGIVAFIGDIKRFPCHDKLAGYAGLVWKKRQTGKSESEETRMVRECDKYLKYYLVEA